MTRLIERNTTIPTRKAEVFSTAEDNQPSVEIHVLQGEREMAAYNKSLGKFQLTGIPPAPRGIPQIEVAFDIDANGILNVSAKDLGTGKEQKIEIKAGSGLSEDEIKRMVTDAESHADEDRKARELAEARNNGENAAYQAERQLTELGDQVDADSKQRIEAAIKDVRESLTSEDPQAIAAKTEALQSAFHAVSEAMYQHAQEQAAAAGAPGAGAADGAPGAGEPSEEEDVVDAEVVEDRRADRCQIQSSRSRIAQSVLPAHRRMRRQRRTMRQRRRRAWQTQRTRSTADLSARARCAPGRRRGARAGAGQAR